MFNRAAAEPHHTFANEENHQPQPSTCFTEHGAPRARARLGIGCHGQQLLPSQAVRIESEQDIFQLDLIRTDGESILDPSDEPPDDDCGPAFQSSLGLVDVTLQLSSERSIHMMSMYIPNYASGAPWTGPLRTMGLANSPDIGAAFICSACVQLSCRLSVCGELLRTPDAVQMAG